MYVLLFLSFIYGTILNGGFAVQRKEGGIPCAEEPQKARDDSRSRWGSGFHLADAAAEVWKERRYALQTRRKLRHREIT